MAFHSTYSPNFDCLAMVGAASGPTALGANTLAAWVNFNSLATDGEIIEVNATGGGNGSFDSAILYNFASSKLEFTQRTSTTNRDFVATFTVSTNTWIHVALTWDGTNLIGYANGVQIGSNLTGAMAGTRGNWANLQLGPATADIQDGVFYTAALSAAEILALYSAGRQPKRRTNLYCWVPCFPGSNRGLDLSGNANNLPANGTPTDSTITPPSVGWGTGRTRLILPATSATAIDAAGTTQTTGSAALTASAGLAPSGLTRTTGAAAMTAAAPLAASGLTQTTGNAAMTAAAALVPSGLTRTTGAASFGSVTFPVVASGLTQTTGSATLTAAAPLVAAGLTQTTGSAAMTAAAALVASGLTQTTGIATLGGATPATGLTQTTGAAAMTAAAALTASGLTRTTGVAALSSAAALAASGVTQTSGAAIVSISANINITASGLTRTTGAAEFFVPVVDIPQRWTAAPRQTIWVTTDPFQPQDYASVLGSKLIDYWHSELGIALDGSSNVQNWTGQLRGLLFDQTLGAGQRPLYGADASFNGRNVVGCRITGLRCLAYKPGSAIFNQGDRPGIVHISRYVTVPTGATATYLVNMGAANAPTPPAIFNNDFFDGTIITTAQRRGVVRTVNHSSPFGLTVFDPAPVTTSPSMRALGLTSTQFTVYTNGQLAGFVENNENLSESWDQLVLGAATEAGLTPCDCNVAMVFLCRNMPSQFEAMQLYQLAKAEWGI